VADAIFISYRRDDSEGEAGRLFDDLTRAFGNDAIFMDVAGIKPGVDFRKAIEDNVASCGVFLTIIGPSWATISNSDGVRRLEDPSDFVALEVASALRREVPVIPVLVHDAKMPSATLLPESLKGLAYHNSVELSHTRWNSDVALLVEALKAYVTPKTTAEVPVHGTVPVQLPAPHHPEGSATPAPAKSKTQVIISIATAAIVVAGAIAYFAIRPAPNTQPVSNPSTNPGISPAANQSANPASPSVVTPPALASPTAGYLGTWIRTGGPGSTDTLSRLVISNSGGGFIIHAYAGCQDATCDWGEQPGIAQGATLVATFSPPPSGSDTARTALVTVRPAPGGIDVLVQNTFENPTGERKNSAHRIFEAAQ
jgi:TIR domain